MVLRPEVEDSPFEDFRLKFFQYAFGPPQTDVDRMIAELSWHPWLRRILWNLLRPYVWNKNRSLLDETMDDASIRFAVRLWQNPTLGIGPADAHLWPGFIKNHCRSIVSFILREQRETQSREESRDPDQLDALVAMNPNDYALKQRAIEFFEDLPKEEQDVAWLRWIMGFSILETARELGLGKHTVIWLQQNARRRGYRYFKLDAD